jgi:hypothetical protein
MWGTIERRFLDVNRLMRYPGVCNCVWINYIGDHGRDTSGTYNAQAVWYDIASSWQLARLRTGDGIWEWVIYVSRFAWDWGYYHGLYGESGYNGWYWSELGPGSGNDCDNGAFYGAGYPGYGYGWGYGWGYGFDPAYWGIGVGWSAIYRLQGAFNCRGTNHFVRDDVVHQDDEGYEPHAFPAWIDVTREALAARVPTA